MTKVGFLLLIGLAGAVGGELPAQQVIDYNGPLPSTEELLAGHHINTDRESLIAALHNTDKEVRALAGYKLAEDGIKAAVPEVAAALEREMIPITRIRLAQSLAMLGDARGAEEPEGGLHGIGVDIRRPGETAGRNNSPEPSFRNVSRRCSGDYGNDRARGKREGNCA
jgi:hypothetical protein